jgi:hypothetical protein
VYREFKVAVQFLETDALIAVDCRDGSSQYIHNLRLLLARAQNDILDKNRAEEPILCSLVATSLENYRHEHPEVHFVEWQQYCKVVKTDDSLDDDMLRAVTRYLHRVGQVHFDESEDSPLRGIVIIDLHWLYVDVLGWVMCPKFMLEAHHQHQWIKFRESAEEGPVHLKHIPVNTLPTITGVDMIRVLEHFQLCYELITTDPFSRKATSQYVFPALLAKGLNDDSWQFDEQFDLHVGVVLICSQWTRMLPPGFMPRLQVNLVMEATKQRGVHEIFKDCVLVALGEAQALVHLSHLGRAVSVHVRGTSSARLECMRLLALVVRCVQFTLQHSRGVSLTVGMSDPSQLCQYVREPKYVKIDALINARNHGEHQAPLFDHSNQISVCEALGLPPKCTLRYVETHMACTIPLSSFSLYARPTAFA